MAELAEAIRAKLASFENAACMTTERCEVTGFDEMRDALEAVLGRHKPGYPDGPEFEEHNEPVFDRFGTPQGYVRVKGERGPGYYCETCREFSPCPTVQDVAQALGIEAGDE